MTRIRNKILSHLTWMRFQQAYCYIHLVDDCLEIATVARCQFSASQGSADKASLSQLQTTQIIFLEAVRNNQQE